MEAGLLFNIFDGVLFVYRNATPANLQDVNRGEKMQQTEMDRKTEREMERYRISFVIVIIVDARVGELVPEILTVEGPRRFATGKPSLF